MLAATTMVSIQAVMTRLAVMTDLLAVGSFALLLIGSSDSSCPVVRDQAFQMRSVHDDALFCCLKREFVPAHLP